MPSPAERYAGSRRRASHPQLAAFAAERTFELDEFQQQACEALEAGHGVLVAAPTGAGKTLIGEFAVRLALAAGGKCFYTTPIKALSNQKFHDLVAAHGEGRVGLLTGDNSINSEAPVVVMTTEVLRNMLYAGSPTLRGLSHVVMDEVHYLADRWRGAVWEEVILHLDESVRLVSLSATVSNAEEFGEWLQQVRGDTTVVVSEHRPVPLWQSVMVGRRLYDLFVDADQEQVNPALTRLAADEARLTRTSASRPHRGGHRPRSRIATPSRPEVVERLDDAGLLPAIAFIFSRAGCESAVEQCLRSGLRLIEAEERAVVDDVVQRRLADIDETELDVIGLPGFLAGLHRGVAAHHAGMLPAFREIVEELFAGGAIKAVFATETLSLGINMPARSVVLEALSKWNGEAHADLTPGEYTQLTGRAGRRGIDVEGHGVAVWTPGFDPRHLAGLASTRTYPLRSSFQPSYTMAVNLVSTIGRAAARDLLEQSFAQFQADRAVVGVSRQLHRNKQALAGYAESMQCHLGNFEEYADLRRRLSDVESAQSRRAASLRRDAAAGSLQALHTGDVIRLPGGRRSSYAVVVDPHGARTAGPGDPRPVVVTEDRQLRKLSAGQLDGPVTVITRIRLPKGFNPRVPQSRRDLIATLRTVDLGGADRARSSSRERNSATEAAITELRAAIRRHPCHGCAEREDHARWAERHDRLRRDNEALQRRIDGRTHSVARMFDRVCDVLERLGYLSGDTVTADGQRLARIYSHSDLVVAEALRLGQWDDLAPADLAAVVSALVYESRRDDESPRLPPGPARGGLAELAQLAEHLRDWEAAAHLSFVRPPDPGFAWAAWRWARGHALGDVLADTGLAAGDFVRWVKQLLDLLDQIATVAAEGSRLRASARAAVDSLRRGVVAYSSFG
jgi:ATP-dependent RNA helicase HelY